MDHPFEHRAHYNALGEPCHCPWGYDEGGEHLGSVVKESSKLDWLKGRPDMKTPRNDFFLKYLQGTRPDINPTRKFDKMLPWLHREFKKGRLLPTVAGSYGQFKYRTDGEPWGEGRTTNIPHQNEQSSLPWFANESLEPGEAHINARDLAKMQDNLQEMQKRGQGIDLMQHKVHEVMPKIDDFQTWKKAQDRKDLGEVLHRFPDGWSVRRLQNPEEVLDEGREMGHCMREPENRYADEVEQGYKIYASLRDPNNLPHVTMEVNPDHWKHSMTQEKSPRYEHGWIPQVGPESSIGEFYGKSDAPPKPEYTQRMQQWLEPYGVPMEWEENPEADLYREQQGLAPAIASVTRPLYYRWIYSPSKGVTLGSNQDDHPALVKYHQGLGGDINDTDLIHGYASALDGGWRISDLEHKPVEDPYIVQQVVRRLNHEDGSQITAEGSWQPSEYNWDRLHYALPCEEFVS